jgi:peptidoglycan/LPS O-acetylase OafA/YrhL
VQSRNLTDLILSLGAIMPVGTDKFASPGAFRLILALVVFLHHTTNFNLGMSAVLVFFVLSGYWVAVMWTEIYSKTTSAYWTYLVSRIWRVLPVFALCSAISWALLVARGATPELAGSMPHQIFSNIAILGYNSLPFQANIPGWSLDMEMQFYLIAPVVISLVSKNIWVVLVCALGSLFSQKLGGSATVAPFLFFFAIGVTAARHNIKPSRTLAYSSMYLTLAMLFLFGMILVKNIMLDEPHRAPLLAFSTATNGLVALMMTPWALYTTRQKGGSKDRMFGDMSYIFYLLHWSVLGALRTGEGSYGDRFLLCTEALVLIFVASFVIWGLFDHPINLLRSAWVSRRRVRPAQALEKGADAGGVLRQAQPVF